MGFFRWVSKTGDIRMPRIFRIMSCSYPTGPVEGQCPWQVGLVMTCGSSWKPRKRMRKVMRTEQEMEIWSTGDAASGLVGDEATGADQQFWPQRLASLVFFWSSLTHLCQHRYGSKAKRMWIIITQDLTGSHRSDPIPSHCLWPWILFLRSLRSSLKVMICGPFCGKHRTLQRLGGFCRDDQLRALSINLMGR